VQRTYEEVAAHYGTVILPARPAKPRDKAKIEVAVQVAERWILARLRHETFFSLAALNARIAELLADLNARPMRLYRASRRELFARLDQPALRPLPAEPFIYGEWKIHARVSIDYHVELHGHYYSVPYPLIHEHVDARLTAAMSEKKPITVFVNPGEPSQSLVDPQIPWTMMAFMTPFAFGFAGSAFAAPAAAESCLRDD
jgi:transposase